MPIRRLPLLRDTALAVVLHILLHWLLAPFILSFFSTPDTRETADIILTYLFDTLPFILIGYLALPPRWPHLAQIALLLWIIISFMAWFTQATLENWLLTTIDLAATVALGGYIGTLLRDRLGPPLAKT